MKDKSSEKQSRPNNLSEFKKECKDYEAMQPASSEEKVLDWWRGHQEELPILSTLARIILAVPVASSKSERVFSAAGRVVTPSRSRIAPEKVDNLVTVSQNSRLLKEMQKMSKYS